MRYVLDGHFPSHTDRIKSQKIQDDPGSEEVQGKNLVKASFNAGVQCFIWSSLPSSAQISGGRLVSKIYEGKARVPLEIYVILTSPRQISCRRVHQGNWTSR